MDGGLYDVVPDIFLKKGSYTYTVTFEGNSSGSFLWMHNYTNFFNAFEEAVVDLEQENSGITNSFRMNVDLHMTLRLWYSGNGDVKVTGLLIRETSDYAKRGICNTVFLFVFLELVLLFIRKRKKNRIPDGTIYSFAVLLGVALFLSYPVLTNSVLTMGDMEFHVARVEGIKDGLLDGQFPVRISPDFYEGYGYADPIFYGNLFLYLPAVLRLLGYSLTEAVNSYIVLINLLTVFGAFWAFHKMLKDRWIAVGAAILYACEPYRLTDLYYRGALGEYTAMVFLTFVLYGLYGIYSLDFEKKEFKRSCLTLIAGLTGVIQSHTLTVEMTGGAIILICVLLLPLTFQKKRFVALLKTAGLTVLINLWFIVPFIDYYLSLDLRFKAIAGRNTIQGSGIYLTQLFYTFPNFSLIYNYGEYRDEFPQTIGIALIFGLFISIAAVLTWKGKKEDSDVDDSGMQHKYGTGIMLIVLTILFVWMSSVYFPWDKIYNKGKIFATLTTSIQFLWRILGMAAVTAAGATGVGMVLLKKGMAEVSLK